MRGMTYLEFSWCLQLNLFLKVRLPFKELEETLILGPHLHLLLGSAISMSKYCDN